LATLAPVLPLTGPTKMRPRKLSYVAAGSTCRVTIDALLS
jgi:hypothetical protein